VRTSHTDYRGTLLGNLVSKAGLKAVFRFTTDYPDGTAFAASDFWLTTGAKIEFYFTGAGMDWYSTTSYPCEGMKDNEFVTFSVPFNPAVWEHLYTTGTGNKALDFANSLANVTDMEIMFSCGSSVYWNPGVAFNEGGPAGTFQLDSFDTTNPVADSITYQGKLTNPAGEPVPDGNYQIQFKLCAFESGGELWTSPEKTITTESGLFTTAIEPVPVSLFSASNLWLEVIVGGETLSPRVKMRSVPYAIRAGSL
jgi:hypothetical protein